MPTSCARIGSSDVVSVSKAVISAASMRASQASNASFVRIVSYSRGMSAPGVGGGSVSSVTPLACSAPISPAASDAASSWATSFSHVLKP